MDAVTVPLADTARAAIARLGLPEQRAAVSLHRIDEIEAALQLGGDPGIGREALTQIVVQAGGGDPWRPG